MSTRELPVIAVIPSYNSAETVVPLVGELLDDNHDEVIVVDDNSSDGTVEELRDEYGNGVRVIENIYNLGPAASRNRVLGEVGPSYLRFINSYMELISDGVPETIKSEMSGQLIGAMGGLILNPDLSPIDFSYGPHFSARSWIGSGIYAGTIDLRASHPNLVQNIRSLTNPLFKTDEYPDPVSDLLPHEVGFVAKGNMVVPSTVFENLGGFNERLRYVEDLEFCRRLSYLGLKRIFHPDMEVRRSTPDRLSAKAGNGEYMKSLAKLWSASLRG